MPKRIRRQLKDSNGTITVEISKDWVIITRFAPELKENPGVGIGAKVIREIVSLLNEHFATS